LTGYPTLPSLRFLPTLLPGSYSLLRRSTNVYAVWIWAGLVPNVPVPRIPFTVHLPMVAAYPHLLRRPTTTHTPVNPPSTCRSDFIFPILLFLFTTIFLFWLHTPFTRLLFFVTFYLHARVGSRLPGYGCICVAWLRLRYLHFPVCVYVLRLFAHVCVTGLVWLLPHFAVVAVCDFCTHAHCGLVTFCL